MDVYIHIYIYDTHTDILFGETIVMLGECIYIYIHIYIYI